MIRRSLAVTLCGRASGRGASAGSLAPPPAGTVARLRVRQPRFAARCGAAVEEPEFAATQSHSE